MRVYQQAIRWVCLIAALAGLLGCKAAVQDDGAAYGDPGRFEQAVAQFESLDAQSPPPSGAVVVVGSSSMRFWAEHISEDLAPLTIIARGFGGSNMNDLLHYVDRLVLRYKPRAVLIYEGDNDIAQGVSPEKIVKTFERLVAVIHDELPECRVYVLSIKPSPARWDMWSTIRQTNARFAKVCDRNDLLTYIDIAGPMLGADGLPREELYVKDRLHMTRAGYEVWRDAVRPVLVEAERRHELPND